MMEVDVGIDMNRLSILLDLIFFMLSSLQDGRL